MKFGIEANFCHILGLFIIHHKKKLKISNSALTMLVQFCCQVQPLIAQTKCSVAIYVKITFSKLSLKIKKLVIEVLYNFSKLPVPIRIEFR